MEEVHEMRCISHSPGQTVLECPTCGRAVAFSRDALEVVVEGDRSARHLGGVGDVVVAVQLGQP